MILVFALIAFGLVMIYSVSKYLSLQVTNQESDKYYLIRQFWSLGFGILVWIFFQVVDFHVWRKNSGTMLFITILLLASVFIFGKANSSDRWINLFGIGFQPSEFAKLTLIFYLSGWLSNKKNKGDIDKTFIPFIVIMSAISILMLVQKDLGTLSIILAIAATIYISAGAKLSNILYSGSFGAFLLWVAIKIEPYRLQRLTAFFNPSANTLTTSYHIQNALIAIGSGGLFGLGFGQSKQKFLYLPEAHTDSIFPIIVEELGFLRSSVIVLIYCIIAYRGFRIAQNAPDDFSKLVAVGVTTWIIWQAFVNLASMLAIVPMTGVPLPFISYGGTSLVAFLAGVGVLLNISKYSKK